MRRLPLLTIFLAVALVATNARGQQAKPEARPLLVGVVDVERVFHSCKRHDDLIKQVDTLKDQFEGNLKATAAEIEAIRRSLDGSKATPAWREKRVTLKLLIKKGNDTRELADEELRLDIWQITLMLRDEIEAAVRDYGKKNGYDLILKTHASAGSTEEGFREDLTLAVMAPVLYAGDKVDITDAVLGVMNESRMGITPAKKSQSFK